MNRADAEIAIASEDSDRRLAAARFFGREAVYGDRLRLRRALKVETVPWNKRALERALARAEQQVISSPNGSGPDDAPKQLMSEVRAKVLEEIAGTLIHELSKPIGSLRLVTPTEMNDGRPYNGSRTEARIETLAKLLSGIRSLKLAVSKPEFQEVNLAEIVRETCAVADGYPRLYILAGPAPFPVVIDPNLLGLALGNLIRNACDALHGLPQGSEQLVTINWGRGGREVWLSVLDTGMGFESNPSSMMGFGQTSKTDHIGFGLATAREAMHALEGDVYPDNASQGGACVILRWISGDEDSIR